MLQDLEMERRLTVLEERQKYITRDLATVPWLVSRVHSLEASVTKLTTLHTQISRSMESMDSDVKKLVVGGLLAIISILGQYIVLKVGI